MAPMSMHRRWFRHSRAIGAAMCATAVVVAVACGVAMAADATLMVGAGQHVTHESSTSAAATTAGGSDVGVPSEPIAGGGASGALVINATFDSSITGNPNSAAIQAMI